MDKAKNRKKAVGFMLSGLVLFLLPFFMWQNEVVHKFASVLHFLGSCYFFTGISFFPLHLPIEKRRSMAMKILYGGLTTIAIAIVLKLLRMPGANAVLATGFFLIAFTYGPILGNIRKEKWQGTTKKKWHVAILSFGDIASVGLIVSGILGKIMLWSFADYLLLIGSLFLVVSLLVWNQVFSTEVILRKEAEDKVTKTLAELQFQHKLIEEKNKEIFDSLNYAKRIQNALLASETLLKNNLPDHFVFFKPKDVVSGDFYWATPTPDGFVYITADCTGHGVPGAFMSLLNISKLSETIKEKKITRPDLILNNIRAEIINALNPEGSEVESKDGMDCVLCKLNLQSMELEYSAANNSFYIIRNKELIVCLADKMPVGKAYGSEEAFTYNKVSLQKGDMIYTFSDGYPDQFGGPNGKKFKYKRMEDLLISVSDSGLSQQHIKIERAFSDWKGGLDQIDDVCIIGIRV